MIGFWGDYSRDTGTEREIADACTAVVRAILKRKELEAKAEARAAISPLGAIGDVWVGECERPQIKNERVWMSTGDVSRVVHDDSVMAAWLAQPETVVEIVSELDRPASCGLSPRESARSATFSRIY